MLKNKYFSWRRVFLGFLEDGMDLSQLEPYELLDGLQIEENPAEDELTQDIQINNPGNQ